MSVKKYLSMVYHTVLFAIGLVSFMDISHAANVPQAANVNQYGLVIDSSSPTMIVPGGNLSSVVTIACSNTSTTSGNYYRFIKWGSSTNGANYQVTSGKTLYCSGISALSTGAISLDIGYGTTAVTDNNSAAPSGEVQFAAGSNGRTFPITSYTVFKYFPFPMSFPSGSYPFCLSKTSSIELYVILVCQEQ